MENFNQRKKEILSKKDKSSKQSWDEKIIPLCEKINGDENYYTSSSCSGRILVIKDCDKKGPNLFEFVSHDFVDCENFLKSLPKEKAKLNLKFKQEPVIIHVACNDLDSANELYEKAKLVGFKRSGLVSWNKNFILELNSTEKLEFPIIENGKLLVDEIFLKKVLDISNKNLKKGWDKINKLKSNL
jgi:tRNA wybutosine-synthesizing protein 3